MIKFYSLIPELVQAMPIERAKISSFQWYKKMLKDYTSCPYPPEGIHTAKCPGIIGICNTGWIQRAYQDFSIVTFGDKRRYLASSEIDQAKLQPNWHYVHSHAHEQLFKYNEFKKDTLETVLKIQSPWLVDIPDGYSLLSMPIPYNDENNFTAATGILKGFNFLNVQLYWHELNGEVIIKKGTPLAQYVLLKDENVEHSLNTITYDEVKERLTPIPPKESCSININYG